MTPREIKNALEDKNLTQRAIAQKIGVSEMSVSDVINRKRISDRIMRAVAEAIGENYCLVFADYYLRRPKRVTSKAEGI